jgi:diguanylate cyclase (GGDEF)-like protein
MSKLLWNETTLDGLLRRFASYLKDRFGVCRFSLFSLETAEDHPQFTVHGIEIFGIFPLRNDIRTALLQTLATIPKENLNEMQDGFCKLSILGNDLFVALVGEPGSQQYALSWTLDYESEGQTRRGLAVTTRIGCEIQELEFLVRQMQGQFKWFGLLDKTQALLFRDDLTGLFNYRYLDIALEAEVRRSARFQTPFSVLFIDLDDFKSVNDRHGHLTGSNVLKQVADCLITTLREIDVVIRYGGDEYVAILLGATSRTGLMAAERIRRAIDKFNFTILGSDQKLHLTASIGVASYPEHGGSKDELLKSADENMYFSKRHGKNKVTLAKAVTSDTKPKNAKSRATTGEHS